MLKRILALLIVVSLLTGIPVLEAAASGEDDVLRIFIIGNSYGYDSTQLLWKVYQTQNPDQKVQIGAMYYSGCSVEQHLNFIRQESEVYDYKRTDDNGTWVTSENVTMDTGLLDQQWDIVILMQGQYRGGDDFYYTNGQIKKLQEYVLSKMEVKPQLYWNSPWIMPQDTYFQDPEYMTQPPDDWANTLLDRTNGDMIGTFRNSLNKVKTYIASDPTFTKVLNTGTVIQYANNMLGQTERDLYRDYTHLSDYGRLIVAHMIYCQIEGLTTLDSVNMDAIEKSLRHTKFQKYGDLNITAEQKQVIVDAVNYSLKNPYEVPDAPVTAEPCKQCTTEPVWTAWNGSNLPAEAGHYYLTDNVTLNKTNVLTAGDYTVSINLNGHTIHSADRAFEIGEGVTLSIMDSVGTGQVSSKGNSDQKGAVAYVHSGGTLVLHGGTLTMSQSSDGGNVIYAQKGNVKVHGGTITDGKSATTEDVYMSGNSSLFARDGEISSVVTDGQVTVSRYATIGVLTPGSNAVLEDILKISNFFVGSVGLNLSVLPEEGVDIGSSDEKGSLNGECFYLIGNDHYGAVLQDSQLILKEKTYCEHCKKLATWHAITETGRPNTEQLSGHFYLDFNATACTMNERILFPGTEVCLNLNGKVHNGIARAFSVDGGATLNIMGAGKVSGRGSFGDMSGGTIYISEGGTLNLYGGTIGSQMGNVEKRTADKGGVLAVKGTLNMYGGTVDPASSYTPERWPAVGGAIYVGNNGTINMSGGQILNGTAAEIAPCIYVDAGGQIRLTGDADIAQLYFAESSANCLTITNSYSGTMSLGYPSGVALNDMTDVGNSENAEITHAFITFTDVQNKTVTVSGSDLVITEFPYVYGTCDACGECWWVPATDADFDAFGKYDMPPGHYILTENVITNQKQLNRDGSYPGNYCLDLAGYTFGGDIRAFIACEGSVLNIMDTVGGGAVLGYGSAAVAGGGIYVAKNGAVNLYGGTVRYSPYNSDTRAAGGAVTVNGGTFTQYGGILEGGTVTGNGGAIQVLSEYDVPGTFVAVGGQVLSGTAKNGNCIYVDQGGNVILSADARVAEIFFHDSSADRLTVSGNYIGTVALKYPESVELFDLVDIGNSLDGNVSNALISFSDLPGKTAAVKGTDLVVSDTAASYGYCEACGLCQWIDINDAQLDAFGKGGMLPGHYRLTENVTTAQKQPNYNNEHPGTYCVDLAGYTFTGESRAFLVRTGAKLNIMDSVGGGVVSGHVSSAAAGGVIYVSGGEVHMYGGTVQHTGTMSDVILGGGAVRIGGGTFYLHDGTLVGYPVSTYGGAVHVTSTSTSVGTFVASGGRVVTATAQTAGDCVYVAKNSNVILSGNAQIDEIAFETLSTDILMVQGSYTGAATLRYPDSVELINLTDVGNCIGGDVSYAAIALYNGQEKTVAVKGTELVISDLPYTYGTCQICGECQWVPVNDAQLDAIGKYDMAPGHYILTENVTSQQRQLNYSGNLPGTICIDLAGYTFTGDSRAFVVRRDARLNIFDSVGCGIIQGQATDAVWGGALYVSPGGEIHLYGGTIRHDTSKSETAGSGGAVCARGGDFYLHSGTVEGAKVSGRGAAIFVADMDGAFGSFIALGGNVTAGSAEVAGSCVFVAAGCHVILSGDAKIDQLSFTRNSADMLTVEGNYVGSVTLRYPVTVSLEDGVSIGTVASAGNLSGAMITVGGTACRRGDVDASALVIRECHEYQSTITDPNCTVTGFTTYTCSVCSDSYVDDEVGALGHSYKTKIVDATCVLDGSITETCINCGDSIVQIVPALGHSYETVIVGATCVVDGSVTDTCSVCGNTVTQLVPATGHDYTSLKTAPTCTASGFTTYTCDCGDFYVADEVAPLGHHYENVTVDATCNTDGSITITCSTCGDSKFAIIPATGHSYESGICTACGEKDPAYVTTPTLTLKAPTLEFKDMICVVAFYTAENIEDVVEMGMITYKIQVSQWDVETADHVIPGAEYDAVSGRYFSSSQGIHAKYLVDDVYLACYAKLTDGSYVYTKLAPYSPITYAKNQLKNASNVQLKQLVAAMLNYGAAAQTYFGYHTQLLANACMTEEQQALPEIYRSDMVQAVPTASTEKQGVFANNKGFSVRKPAISFEGAFCINYFFTPAYAPVDGIMLYFWDEADYEVADVLTMENASGQIQLEGTGTEQYRGDIEGISAKNLSQAVYVAAVYSDGTTTWTSGVLGYSIGAYCSSQASKGGDVAELAMATAVYGYHAKAYFG